MALKDHPALQAEFDRLQTEKAALEQQIAPLRERYDTMQEDIERLIAEQKSVGDQIHAIERPRMIEINTQMSAIARATGGRALSDAK